MKLLLVCFDDYANYMYNTYLSFRVVGVECECIKLKKHDFGYDNEAPVVTEAEALEKIRSADAIHFFHSNVLWWDIISREAQNKFKAVYHTGTLYRRDPAGMNKIFASADMFITDQCEFICLENNSETWKYLATAVDTEKIKPEITTEKQFPYVIAHYPSNSSNKGTEKVINLMQDAINLQTYNTEIRMRFICSTVKVPHADQLKRMMDCNVYIEMFAPTQHGNPYGCYGVTAFEAASMGKIVVTQNIYPEVYKNAYGCDYPFVICNTEVEFKQKIYAIIQEPIERIKQLQEISRTWILSNHSYEATGRRLKNIFSID